MLPTDLGDALTALEEDDGARRGARRSRSSTPSSAYKRNELERFGKWITDWEFEEYTYHSVHTRFARSSTMTQPPAGAARPRSTCPTPTASPTRADSPSSTPCAARTRCTGTRRRRRTTASGRSPGTTTSGRSAGTRRPSRRSKFVNIEEVDDELRDARRSMLETDGPRHPALRRLMQREFAPRNLRELRGLPARADQEHHRRRVRAARVRLRARDQRRLPDPGPGPAARRPARGHPAADRLGQRVRRQHRPGVHRAPARTARRATSTSTCRSGRRPCSTCGSTATTCARNARRR